MKGPVILVVVAGVTAFVLWLALAASPDADLERGLEETELAFSHVTEALLELDPLFKEVTSQGLMLNLRGQHDSLRSRLATLKAEALQVADDARLPRGARLPALRDLRDQADELLGQTLALHRHLRQRYDFMLEVSPLLGEARRRRDAPAALGPLTGALEGRRAALVGAFADLESQARSTDRAFSQHPEQAEVLAATTLKSLRGLVEAQRALERDAGEAP